MNHPAKRGRVRSFKNHSTSTRLPRKEAETREQLYRAVEQAIAPPLSQEEAFQRAVAKGLFAGLSPKRGTV